MTTVGNDFLCWNNSLQELKLPNLITVGGKFFFNNNSLQELSLPKLTTVGDRFLPFNCILKGYVQQYLTKDMTDSLHNKKSLKFWLYSLKENLMKKENERRKR